MRAALRSIGAVVAAATAGQERDLEVALSDGSTVLVEVKPASIPTVDRVRSVADNARPGISTMVVADQIPAPVRAVLVDAGIGWLDRRGHLRLVAPGCFVDTDVAPIPRRRAGTGAKREPIAGRSGLAAAAALLMHPDDPMTVADIARAAGLNRSSISRALAGLADAHLAQRVDRGRYRPLVPELFWSLAEVWPTDAASIRWNKPPENDDRLGIRADDLGVVGWAAAGVPTAIAWGAPLVATSDTPIHLYVPDDTLIRDALMLHDDGDGAQALLSVDPIGLITAERFRAGALAWPAAHPLFSALDLTAASRDHEALEQWTPPEGFTRVW